MAYSDRIDSNHSDANFQRQTQTVIELFRVFAIYIEIPGIFIPSFWIYSEFLVAILLESDRNSHPKASRINQSESDRNSQS